MTLEEALARIEELETEATGLKDTSKTALADLTKQHEKALQVSYNKGFDKAKNASDKDVKDGYVKKEDVDKMLEDRDTAYGRKSALAKMGVKNPSRAMKSIDDEDLATIGSDDFDEEAFKKKYGEDIVFTASGNPEEKDETKPPSNHTKNNKQQKEGLTAEKFEAMSAEDRAKVSTAEKLALL